MNDTTLEIYSDGGSRGNPGHAAAAFVVLRNGEKIYEENKLLGITTNNVAEYSGVVMAFNWLNENLYKIKVDAVRYCLDSQLIAYQLSGKYRIKNLVLKKYYDTIKKLEKTLAVKIAYIAIPREKNKYADMLVNKALDEK